MSRLTEEGNQAHIRYAAPMITAGILRAISAGDGSM